MAYAENFKPMALVVMIALAVFVSNTGENPIQTQANTQIQTNASPKAVTSPPCSAGVFSAAFSHQDNIRGIKLMIIHFKQAPRSQTCASDTRV